MGNFLSNGVSRGHVLAPAPTPGASLQRRLAVGMFQPPPPRCTHEARMCVQATQRRLATGHCRWCMLSGPRVAHRRRLARGNARECMPPVVRVHAATPKGGAPAPKEVSAGQRSRGPLQHQRVHAAAPKGCAPAPKGG